MIQKTCDVTGEPMAEGDLDFGHAVANVLAVDPVKKLTLHVAVQKASTSDVHVSAAGLKLLLGEGQAAVDALVTKVAASKAQKAATGTTPVAAQPTPQEGTPKASAATAPAATGPTLTRK